MVLLAWGLYLLDLCQSILGSGFDSGATLEHIRRGALLHDIGKMGIPDRILQKPGALTDDEWEIMERPTQADVARLAGVSRTTVPYVMNNQTGGRVPISEETRQRVVDARAQALRNWTDCAGYSQSPLLGDCGWRRAGSECRWLPNSPVQYSPRKNLPKIFSKSYRIDVLMG